MSLKLSRLLAVCLAAALAGGCLGGLGGVGEPLVAPTTVDVAERAPDGLEFDVIDYRWFYINDGAHLRVRGRVRNNSGRAVQAVMLQGVLYDQKGRFLAQGNSYLAPTYLKPGAEAEFEFTAIPARESGVTSTRLVTSCESGGIL